MYTYKINIPSGVLSVCFVGERPDYTQSRVIERGRTLFVYPSESADFEAVLYMPDGIVSRAVIDPLAALSFFLGRVRGIPTDSLTVSVSGKVHDLPKVCTPPNMIRIPLSKCKHLFAKVRCISGGMPERLVTVVSDDTTRIVRTSESAPYPAELLARLRIIDGLPDACRTIAYFPYGGVYRAVSTDTHEVQDSFAPLLYLLESEGARGGVAIRSRRAEYKFFIDDGGIFAEYTPTLIS